MDLLRTPRKNVSGAKKSFACRRYENIPCKLGGSSLKRVMSRVLLHGYQVLLVEVVLILFSIVGLDGLRLDDDSCIASGERSAFSGDGSGYITRGQS